ncbi:ABC transporter substrate-binding protein [Rubeoparvulum massiliense]|uniref:ABC transporter substrate-binding protein n=1 Tax=Rubeoparvulum massiliense TaxID=1631346 RepID=UPI00065E532C|nr:ABC transporter substrate-binding protein [Rubeoparvulum massiliense]
MNRKRSLVWTLLLVLVLMVTACSSGSQEGGVQPKENDANASKQNASSDPGKGAAEQVLIFGRGGDSVALDPGIVTDGESLKVTLNIFDTLLDYEEGTTNVIPHLAKDWEISEDGLTYTFYLEQGVKFHDGTDFNADAVVFNFERWMLPDHPHRYSDQDITFEYYNSQFGGTIDQEGHVITKVEKVDENTVRFHLTRPQAPFLQNIAMPPFAIASPEAIKTYGDKFMENPVGTGPFMFQEWKRNDYITLVKNPNFWKAGYPKLDKLIYRSIPDNGARFNALLSGQITIMDGINPDDIALAEKNPDFQIIKRPPMNVGYLGFNVEKPPLDNPKVRIALSHAVNKEALIQAFFNGMAEPAKNPMPPSIWGYNDEIEDYPYDLEKAKQLLAEAGYPDGFELELWAMPVPRDYMPNGMKIAEALQADFAKIGVQTTIVTRDWTVYLDETRQGKQEMFLLGWTGDNGDPDNFIYVLLDQDNINGSNRARYANDEVHKLLIEAQSVTDQSRRVELYKQAQALIHQDAPWVPLVHSTPVLVGSSKIQDYVAWPTGSEKLTRVYLAE